MKYHHNEVYESECVLNLDFTSLCNFVLAQGVKEFVFQPLHFSLKCKNGKLNWQQEIFFVCHVDQYHILICINVKELNDIDDN